MLPCLRPFVPLQFTGMMLRHKIILQIGALIVSLLLISGASLWGINGLHHDFGLAVRNYERLRWLYEIGQHVRSAQRAINQPVPDIYEAKNGVANALNIRPQFLAAS